MISMIGSYLLKMITNRSEYQLGKQIRGESHVNVEDFRQHLSLTSIFVL